jgi:hypothetical protein
LANTLDVHGGISQRDVALIFAGHVKPIFGRRWSNEPPLVNVCKLISKVGLCLERKLEEVFLLIVVESAPPNVLAGPIDQRPPDTV